ncbi:MAG: acetyltransferase [Rhodocyclaceae bacterium]|nr:acetyltransferase [Rhodocyclaceae bacterium]
MRVLIIGAGGHAKVVIDALEQAGHTIAGVVDEKAATSVLGGYPVFAGPALPDADGFIVAIGDNAARRDRFEHYGSLLLTPATVVHPAAVIADSATIGPGSVVFAGAIVNSDAVIGENVILNTGCTIDHDCSVEAHAHIGPGANLCGNVMVGEGALVGVGACAIPGAKIGSWSVVGAGSVVVDRVKSGVTAVGAPARQLR